mmetsp:Transcript_113978/g.329223  ORF Transcript_113978/g.329223 Transcript_113978/m.329223 type:complete len:204 (+) Transcript_113978:53-664(+)
MRAATQRLDVATSSYPMSAMGRRERVRRLPSVAGRLLPITAPTRGRLARRALLGQVDAPPLGDTRRFVQGADNVPTPIKRNLQQAFYEALRVLVLELNDAFVGADIKTRAHHVLDLAVDGRVPSQLRQVRIVAPHEGLHGDIAEAEPGEDRADLPDIVRGPRRQPADRLRRQPEMGDTLEATYAAEAEALVGVAHDGGGAEIR